MFIAEVIRNSGDVGARELIKAWEEYHGSSRHGECRMCELAEWLNGFDAFNMHPQPYQGDAENGLFRGQPVVWDGSWECVAGQLWYVGSDGPSGGDGPVKRALVLEDKVLFS